MQTINLKTDSKSCITVYWTKKLPSWSTAKIYTLLNNNHKNSHRNHSNRIFYKNIFRSIDDLCVPQEACHELFRVFGTFYASRTQDTGITKSLCLAGINFCSFYLFFLLSQSREVFCQLVQQMKNQHSENIKNQASVFIGTWNMGKIFWLEKCSFAFKVAEHSFAGSQQ